jgi:hypothetical protein
VVCNFSLSVPYVTDVKDGTTSALCYSWHVAYANRLNGALETLSSVLALAAWDLISL